MSSKTESTPVALHIADLSAFCKALRTQLPGTDAPGHLALLNMQARSAGHRNYQALRAKPSRIETPATPTPAAAKAIVLPRDIDLPKLTTRVINHFDTSGRLMRWPTQYSVQQLAMWGLWLRLPGKRDLTETQVNGYLNAFHTFADPATLRRELVNAKLLWRTIDGRVYRKVAKPPQEEASQFIKQLMGMTTC